MIIRFIFTFLLIFITDLCHSQDYKIFSEKDGLASNHVYRIVQDLKGNIWFSTTRGISKYDGYNFQNFTYRDGLPNQDVWELAVDKENRLWFFSKSKLQGYIEKGKVKVFPLGGIAGQTPTFFNTENGMYIYNNSNPKEWSYLKSNKWEPLDVTNFMNVNIQKTTRILNPEKKMFALLGDDSIEFVDLLTGKVISKISDLPQSFYEIINNDRRTIKVGVIKDQLYYYFTKKGIIAIDFNLQKVYFLTVRRFFNESELSPTTKINVVNGEIQISSPKQILVFDTSFRLKKKFTFSEFENNVNGLIDTHGNIWLNNLSSVAFLSSEQRKTQYSFLEKRVKKIGFINGSIYVGTDFGFYKLDETNPKNSVLIADGQAYNLREKQKILVTSEVSKIFENGAWKTQNFQFPIKVEDISYKDLDEYQRKYYLTFFRGIHVFDENKRFLYTLPKANLTHSIIYKNQLYFASNDGFFKLDNKNLSPIEGNIISNPIVSSLVYRDFLLLGSSGKGVFVFDGKKIQSIPSTNGLVVEKILLKDNEFWLATNEGVVKLKIDHQNILKSKIIGRFTEDDGLLSNNTNDIYYRFPNLYVASDRGLAKIDVTNQDLYRKVPIYFTNLQKTLIVEPKDRNSIKINFSSKDFVKNKSTKFYYRIPNLSKDWQETAYQEIVLNYLSPGDYVLEVKSVTTQNVESQSSLNILVKPKWYELFWFKLSIGILGLLMFLGLGILIKKRIKKNIERKAEIDKKLAGLELQALRSQMNPYFIHNSLSAIQYYVQRNDVELSEKYLVSFAKLIRMFFEFSGEQSIPLTDEIKLLTHYLEIEKLRFEDKLSYEIICDDELMHENPNVPTMIFQPVLENAINHGVFHKKDNGKVLVSFKKISEEILQVIIEDNGIGIRQSRENKDKQGNRNKVESSRILNERIHLLNLSYNFIEYNVQDLENPITMESEGTRVIINININKNGS